MMNDILFSDDDMKVIFNFKWVVGRESLFENDPVKDSFYAATWATGVFANLAQLERCLDMPNPQYYEKYVDSQYGHKVMERKKAIEKPVRGMFYCTVRLLESLELDLNAFETFFDERITMRLVRARDAEAVFTAMRWPMSLLAERVYELSGKAPLDFERPEMPMLQIVHLLVLGVQRICWFWNVDVIEILEEAATEIEAAQKTKNEG